MTQIQVLSDAEQRSNMWRLSLAQALAGANGVIIFATGAIVGHDLASTPALATLPISLFVIGMALCILPLGKVARVFGRRVAFLLGAMFGVLAGVLAAAAVHWSSFVLFCVATFCGGVYAASSLGFRFAATDGVAADKQARALSLVMAGGVAAGVFGPQLINATMHFTTPIYFASFWAQAAAAALSSVVLFGVHLPDLKPASADKMLAARPLKVIMSQPLFIAAVLTGAMSYLLMNFLMTAAPLAMVLHGHTRADANLGLQWHVIAMYAPSFFTGRWIDRFGAVKMVVLGLFLIAASVLVGLLGLELLHFWTCLILLGVGWNFGFLGASALVLRCHEPQEKTRVQSLNDFLIFSLMAAGSFASGGLLHQWGWTVVLQMSLVPLGLTLLILLLLLPKTRQVKRL